MRIALVGFAAVLGASALGLATSKGDDAKPDPSALAAAMGAEARLLSQTTRTTTPVLPPTHAETTTTTTTTLPTTTTTKDPRALPEAPPSNPYAPTPQIVLGRIEIPKLSVVGDLQEGITLTAINRGPGHWPGSAMPGELGNMVVAGHRTTYSKPFARIDELVAGDRVNFFMPNGAIFVYEVRGVIIVPAANIGIASYSDVHTATLFACHPRGSATQRIVAKLRLLGPDNQPVDPDYALPPISAGADPVTGQTLLVSDSGSGSGSDPLAGSDG